MKEVVSFEIFDGNRVIASSTVCELSEMKEVILSCLDYVPYYLHARLKDGSICVNTFQILSSDYDVLSSSRPKRRERFTVEEIINSEFDLSDVFKRVYRDVYLDAERVQLISEEATND